MSEDKHNSAQKSRTLLDRIVSIGWAIKIAWKIDKTIFLKWLIISTIVSLLPAIALNANREVLSHLSVFISSRVGSFETAIKPIITYGFILMLIGLSSRINIDLIYLTIYDSYYLGMQEYLMEHLQNIEIKELLKSDVNDEYHFVVNRAASLTNMMSSLFTVFGKIVSIVSLLVVAFDVSFKIFIVSFIYVVLVLILSYSFTERTRKNIIKVRRDERHAKYLEQIPFVPGIAKEIRIYGNTESIIEQWRKNNEAIVNDRKTRNFNMELVNVVSRIGYYIFLIIMVVMSIYDVARGSMTTDVFLMVYAMYMNVLGAILVLTKTIPIMDYGLFALERQRKFIKLTSFNSYEDEMNKSDEALNKEKVFSVRGLSFSYINDNPVIKDVSLDINQGEVVALIGVNGCGKTTLVKLLLNMLKPNSGFIKFYGRNISEYKKSFLRKNISVFYQDFYLFHHTLQENIGYGDIDNIYDEEKVLIAVKKGGANRILEKMPNGLNTLIGKVIDKEGIELSGGEKQRLGTARAYMNDSEVLIFDEPASMLDPIAELEQFRSIQNKLDGKTAILISHRVGFARLADKIIMLDNGKIAEMGTHDELMKRHGQYASFFEEQAQWYK